MRDAVRPSPLDQLYPGIGDHPRSILRLSRTHCLEAPSDVIARRLIQYQQQRNPGDYHCYIEGVNADDFGRNTPLPVVIVRNHIHDHEISFAAEASHIVSTQIELLRSTRMTTIRENGFTLTPPSSPPTADSPMTNLEQRLLAFHHSIRNTPPRQSPELRPRANREIHDEVTRQYNIALLSPYGSAFHKRHATYMRRQEFLFRSNMAEHLARFGETPTTDYSLIVPPTLVSRSLIPNYSLAADVLPPRPLSPFSRGIILAHESQQQIQRDYITNAGVTSNAAATILAMNTQSVLDAACSISGSSSRHPHSTHTGILSRTIPLQATATTINHPPPRPKPLNFGLD
jgi:hypothetical protein